MAIEVSAVLRDDVKEGVFKLDGRVTKVEASLCDGLVVNWVNSLKFAIDFEERNSAEEK